MTEKVSTKTYLALLAAILLSFIGILTETSMNVTFPQLQKIFNVPLNTLQLITTGYLLTVTIMMSTTSFLLKRFASKNILVAAALIFITGDVLCATATNFSILLTGRIIQAMATGLSTPIMYHIIFTKIPKAKIGVMTGVAAMVISFAPALGPTYGGTITSITSWRMIFWLILPIPFISIFLGLKYLNIQPTKTTKKFDFLSLILLSATLILWVSGVSIVSETGIRSLQFGGLMLGGLLSLAGFIYSNNHGQSTLLGLTIFKHPAVTLSAVTYFMLQFMNIGMSFLIPIYSQFALNIPPLTAGLILLPGSIAGAFTSTLAGKLADNVGPAIPIKIGNIVLLIGAGMFLILQSNLNALLLTVIYIVYRIGFNMAFANTISNASTMVAAQNSPDVNSIFNMLQQFAGSIGVGILAAIMASFQNVAGGVLTNKTYHGGTFDFILIITLATMALLISLINFRVQKNSK